MQNYIIIGYFIGGIISLYGGVKLIIAAFNKSTWWGLVCLFIPLAWLVFYIKHRQEASKPLLIVLLGWIIAMVSAVAITLIQK